MTREEFDRWIGRNRPRLIRLAWKVCGKYDAADAVQDAIVSIYVNQTYLKVRHAKNLVAYFGRIVTRYGWCIRASRAARLQREVDFMGVVSGYRGESGKRTGSARRAE